MCIYLGCLYAKWELLSVKLFIDFVGQFGTGWSSSWGGGGGVIFLIAMNW